MKINFENLGSIKSANIEIKPLTIFCGKNNTGKTHILHATYGLLKPFDDVQYEIDGFKDFISEIQKNGSARLSIKETVETNIVFIEKKISSLFKSRMPLFFNAEKEIFSSSKIELIFDPENVIAQLQRRSFKSVINFGKNNTLSIEKAANEDHWLITYSSDKRNLLPFISVKDFFTDMLVREIIRSQITTAHLLPAERSGINLFYTELASNRVAVFNHLQNSKVDAYKLFNELRRFTSRYSTPIGDYINWLNEKDQLKKNQSQYHEFALSLQKKVVGGRYSSDKEGQVFFSPYKRNGLKIRLHVASSTVKTFFGLWLYLEHQATRGDILLIDEPELNLHPDNQREVARLLAMLVNKGIKIIISTHSDYIIKEINNLLMLSNSFDEKEKIMKKWGYEEEMTLKRDQVSAYLFDDGEAKEMEITATEGIIANTFDDVINQMNKSSNEIFYAICSE